jgi:NTP pyrophosphatase (non-canonical NTP hydrolase)
MELTKLQERVGRIGQRFVAMEDGRGHGVPNGIAFPMFKAMEELGEVADLLVRKYSFTRKGKEIAADKLDDEIADELADTIIMLTHLANFSGVSLEEGLKRKLKKVEGRLDGNEYIA